MKNNESSALSFFERYALKRSLGSGYIAQVFEASYINNDEQELKAEIVEKVCSLQEEENAAAIENERLILKGLSKHPKIVEMLDFY